MSKFHCIATGCKNAPIDGSRCALHGGEVASLGHENPKGEEREGKTATGETFTAEGGKPEAAVNGEPKRCQALNAKGEPCRSPSVGADGLCASHSGRSQVGTVENSKKAAKAAARARRERAEARARESELARMSLTDRLRVKAAERSDELIDALLDGTIERRDAALTRIVWDRLEGKVADRVEVTDGVTPEELDMLKRSREFAKLTELTSEELHAQLGGDQ